MSKKPKHPKNFLRRWREFRGLTQEQLAATVKPATSAGQISLLENQERGLSDRWLARLAPALNVRRGWLVDVDPQTSEARLWLAWQNIPETDKHRAFTILEAFKKPA